MMPTQPNRGEPDAAQPPSDDATPAAQQQLDAANEGAGGAAASPSTTPGTDAPTPPSNDPAAQPAGATPDPRDAEIAQLRAQVAAQAAASETASPAGEPDRSDAQLGIGVGDVVTRTAFDPYDAAGGQDVSTYGVVVGRRGYDVDDPATGSKIRREVAVVAWLRDASHELDVAELEPADGDDD